MFRLLRVKPPNGWAAVAWELSIVVAGVLIALAVQQWADQRGWKGRAEIANAAIRDELRYHFVAALEWRLNEPCIDAQLGLLAKRLAESGGRLTPSPIVAETSRGVVRHPNRSYFLYSWDAASSDGVVDHLTMEQRRVYSAARNQGDLMMHHQARLTALTGQLSVMELPLPLDDAIRFQLSSTIAEARSVNRILGRISGQIARRLDRNSIREEPQKLQEFLTLSGALQHCRSRGLPVRPARDWIPPEENNNGASPART